MEIVVLYMLFLCHPQNTSRVCKALKEWLYLFNLFTVYVFTCDVPNKENQINKWYNRRTSMLVIDHFCTLGPWSVCLCESEGRKSPNRGRSPACIPGLQCACACLTCQYFHFTDKLGLPPQIYSENCNKTNTTLAQTVKPHVMDSKAWSYGRRLTVVEQQIREKEP